MLQATVTWPYEADTIIHLLKAQKQFTAGAQCAETHWAIKSGRLGSIIERAVTVN